MHQPLDRNAADTPYAWVRLALSLLASTIGGVGMWSVVVVLPAVQAEFGVARGEASLPYTLTMLGFGFGGFAMGTLADRYGVAVTSAIGAVALGLGYVGAAYAGSIWQFALIQGVLIGFLGASATFAPLVADTSHWFVRRRGIAVAICASGNYLSGTLWPPVLQHFVESAGWRPTHVGVGLFCVATLLPLSLAFRRQPAEKHAPEPPPAPAAARPVSPTLVQALLIVAGFACCVAMSMPQVHIVAYCGDLGYGVARGTEMLSIMLGLGIVSRLGSGFLADRIGGLATVLVGSGLQALSLALYLFFDGLGSLYVISAIFGLVQGGIIPSYAIVIREVFPAREAGSRVGVVIMATIFGMAFGGWISGAIFDLTGSYRAAFLHGIAWNVANFAIVWWLLRRSRHGGTSGAPGQETGAERSAWNCYVAKITPIIRVIAVKTVSATECNRYFSKILRDVRAGETVIVTLRGKPVVEIRSANRIVADREAAKQALFTRLRSQPVLNLPRIRRDELYDD